MGRVYDELRGLAASHMRRERADHTIQATALVHEAYLRLVDQDRVDWNDRNHFFAIAGRIMRRVLVNHARDRGRDKRGGQWKRVPLDADAGPGESTEIDLLSLHEAIEFLEEHDERLAQVVELRFFSGMSMEEIGTHMEVDPRTIKRYWKAAKIVLLDRLSDQDS
jgi:RNA polymerase sigma factor (TIGR02999 family)